MARVVSHRGQTPRPLEALSIAFHVIHREGTVPLENIPETPRAPPVGIEKQTVQDACPLQSFLVVCWLPSQVEQRPCSAECHAVQ